MPASDAHPEYTNNLPQWETVRDCVSGAAEIKRKRTKYLPKPNATDNSTENNSRYDQYLNRANFVSFTGATLEGLLGMIFRESPEAQLEPQLEYLEGNATGSGISLEQMVKSVTSQVIQTGRYGVMVDYPRAPEGLTAAEVSAMNLRANITTYKAENIINWQTTVVGGSTVLSLVALTEYVNEYSDDGFSFDKKKYTRVLRLEDGLYQQELYNEEDELVDVVEPRKFDGSRWREIPFTFIGATNNDHIVDKSPLYDIAEVNISHYRNSADFEESCFVVGQPTPVFAGLNQSWVDNVMKGGVLLGSRAGVLLPEGGNATLLQANPNQLPERGMELKEQQMIKLGARLITDTAGNETAEAARIRYAGQNSKLSTIVSNIESAIMQCLDWCSQFMGGTGDNYFELNHEYYEKSVDPQRIIAEMQLLDRGVIALGDIRNNLREQGLLSDDREDDDIDGEVELTVNL